MIHTCMVQLGLPTIMDRGGCWTVVAVGCMLATVEGGVPLPTDAQLRYQRQEIVGLTHFNMATFFRNGDPACDAQNWASSQKPSSFAPTNLNISNWVASYKAVGVKSVILTAKHGCGFLLWPTNVTLPDGRNYGYHVGGAGGIGVDVVAEFAKTLTAAGLPYSFYYSLKDSFYLNAIGDNVKTGGLLPGQINVTQEQFEDVSVAAVTELWSRYGKLNEIWFDGGISQRISTRIVALLKKLQPDAVTYGAGIENDMNEVDWVGTETGEAKYPIWSTGCNSPGGGSTGVSPLQNPTNFCPKGSDCTLQSPDVWFWVPDTPIKSLTQLQTMYHDTVGANSVMELDFAIDRTGNIDPMHAQRYREFGDWIQSCYGTVVATTGWSVTDSMILEIPSSAAAVDRIAIQEDIAQGQRITEFVVEYQSSDTSSWLPFASGTAVGHKRIAIATVTGQVSRLRLNMTGGVELPANVTLAAFAKAPCV